MINGLDVCITILLFLGGSIPALALNVLMFIALCVEMFLALYSIYEVFSDFILLNFQ